MKKIVLILLVLMSLSCSLYDVTADAFYESKIQRTEIYYHEDFENLYTVEDIISYIDFLFDPRLDNQDSWSTPEETLKRGYGDCEDYAILFMNIYYIVFGTKSDLGLVNYTRAIGVGGAINHAIVILPDGTFISQLEETDQTSSISFVYSFDLFFY